MRNGRGFGTRLLFRVVAGRSNYSWTQGKAKSEIPPFPRFGIGEQGRPIAFGNDCRHTFPQLGRGKGRKAYKLKIDRVAVIESRLADLGQTLFQQRRRYKAAIHNAPILPLAL